MSSNTVTCPQCQSEFEVSEVIKAQLADDIRDELQADYASKLQKLNAERDAFTKERDELEEKRAAFDEQVKTAVAEERESLTAKLRDEANRTAQQAVAIDMAERDEKLEEAEKRLKESQGNELALRRRAREIEKKAEQQEVENERKLDEERKAIREEAAKHADEKASMRLAERDQKIDALAKKLEEAQRKIEQGSQQTQGDVQEVALESILGEMFPCDVVERVGKGERGGDVLHHVFDASGRECGLILWESKRTKAWNNDWVGKAIDDQQSAKATIACIVTTALPNGVEHIDQRSGVWVANWSCVRLIAGLLRHSVLEVAQARAATEGQNGKMEMLYNYLSGDEFRTRLRGLVEPYLEMESDLESERRALNKRWTKRRKQLDRVMLSTSGLYGDLQGIIGSGLQEIEGMELLELEAEAGTE